MTVRGGCWPTGEQELLLKAALLNGPESLDAFAQWERAVGFDHMDEGSYRMLPLLGHNLRAQGVDHPMVGRLKGIHRRSWYQNQMLFREIEPFLQQLHAAGIPVMPLKGAAMAMHYYEDAGLRPMRDFDLLVPEPQAVRALQLLVDGGWRIGTAWPGKLAESFRRFRHALAMDNPTGRELDFHWHVLFTCCRPGADDDFWAASVPLEREGAPLRVLAAADQFLHVCAHGVTWNDVVPIRWIADALTILRRSPDFDWHRLMRQTERRRLLLPMRDALRYLASHLAAPIPETVLHSLDSLPVTKAERAEYQRTLQPATEFQTPLDTWRAVYHRYRRSAPRPNPMDFATFLTYYWEVDHHWQLVGRVGRWGRTRIRHLLE